MTCQRSVNKNFLMADLRLAMYVHEIRTEVRDDVITGKRGKQSVPSRS